MKREQVQHRRNSSEALRLQTSSEQKDLGMSTECSRRLAVKRSAFNRAEFQSGQGARKEVLPVVDCAKKKPPSVTYLEESKLRHCFSPQSGWLDNSRLFGEGDQLHMCCRMIIQPPEVCKSGILFP